jgi:hypothetical protein
VAQVLLTDQDMARLFGLPLRSEKGTTRLCRIALTRIFGGMSATEIRPETTIDTKKSPDSLGQRPIVRKGQRKPYFKATRKQIDQRIEVASVLGWLGFTKTQIHHVFRERYGVEWRQTDRYMARARAKKCDALSSNTGFLPSFCGANR